MIFYVWEQARARLGRVHPRKHWPGRGAGGFFKNQRSIMSIISVNDTSPAGASISMDAARS
jgi:hypothetical protein